MPATARRPTPSLYAGVEAAESILRKLLRVDVHKALDPLNVNDLLIIETRLGAALHGIVKSHEAAAVRSVLDSIDIDWKTASQAQVKAIAAAANKKIAEIPSKVMPQLTQTFEASGHSCVYDTKVSSSKKFGFTLSAMNNGAADQKVVKHIAASQGFFVRDAYGQRADAMDAKIRAIVASGHQRGVDRYAIARSIEAQVGATIAKTPSYWNMIAGSFVNRARSYGSLSSFQEAGIETWMFEAVLDEVTTLQCRMMHGRTFSVASALSKYAEVEAAQSPEDVKTIMPWLQAGKDDKGDPSIYYKDAKGDRVHVARVTENAMGKADAQGSFKMHANDAALEAAGCVIPPLHGNAIVGATPITTARGVVRGVDVCPGDLVLSHAGVWCRVTCVRQKIVRDRPILVLQTATGRVLGITYEHPVATAVGWQRAGELHVGDELFDHLDETPRLRDDDLLPDAQYAPTRGDEPSVARGVARFASARPVVLPIDLDGHALGDERDVDREPTDVVLCDSPEGRQEIEQVLFLRCQFLSPSAGARSGDPLTDTRDTGWVRGSHALDDAGEAGVAPEPECPVALSARPARLEFGAVVRDLHLVVPAAHGDPVPLAPRGERCFSNTEAALDRPDRSALLEVLDGDQCRNVVPICEQRAWRGWHSTAVVYIAAARYSGVLVDLSVEGDESYVAAGLVVHNCRSTLIPGEVTAGAVRTAAPSDQPTGAGYLPPRPMAPEPRLPFGVGGVSEAAPEVQAAQLANEAQVAAQAAAMLQADADAAAAAAALQASDAAAAQAAADAQALADQAALDAQAASQAHAAAPASLEAKLKAAKDAWTQAVVDESKAKADWLAAKQLKADSLKIGTAAEQKAAAKALTLADDLYLAAQGASDAAASALSKLEDEDLAASAIAPAAPTVATAAPTATTVFTEAEAKQHALNEIEYLAAGPKGTLTLDAFWKPEQDFQVPSTFYTNGAKKKAIVTLDAAVVKDLASVVLSAPKSALVSAVETPGDLPVLALQKGKYTVVQGEAQAWSMLKQSKPFKCHVLDYDANPKLYDYSTPLGAPKYKSPKKIPGATVQAPIPLPPAAPVKAPPYVHAPPHTPAPAKAPAPYVHAPPHTPAVVVAPIPLPTPVSSAALADKDAVVRWATGTPMHENELLNGIALKPKTPGAPDVWTAAGGHKEVALSEPPMVVKPHMKKSAGCIIVEPDGRIWLVEPKGGFGGYSHTFPKGGIEPGLTLQQTAKKEVFEEAGLECEITGYLGDFEGQTSNTRYYIARRTGGAPWMADAYETSNVKLLTPDQALGFLNADRDKKIIAAFKARTPPLTLAEVMETKTGSQAGSNVGGFYTGKDGVKRYVKEYSNSVQSGGEHLANKLYGDLGVLAPKSALYTPEVKNGRTVYGYSSEIIQGKKLQDVGINADNAKKMLDGFVADVLMGNRDVLGLTMDNVLITPTGAVARIDNGGAFLTQATGPIKSDAMRLGLQEWDGYFTHNPHYKKVLDAAGIKTHEDMRLLLESQLTKVLDVRDAAGGWAKYVEARTPTMDAADRAKIIEMLDKRTAMIEQKVVAMRPPPAPMAPGRVQPLGGKGALSANHPGRPRAVLTGDELHPPPPDMANLAIRNFAQLPKEKVLEKDSLTPDGSAVAAYDKKEIAHLKALKPDSKSGVVRFTGNDYKQMRAAVSMTRDEFAVSKFKHHDYDSCRRDGLLCEKAFTEVTPIPGRVFRNMGDMPESVIKVMMEDDEYGPGKRFNLMGCASTSRKANTGFMGYSSTSSGTYNVRLIIHQQSGIGINDISRHIGEGEVLLSKDTAFRVLRRAMGDGGTGGQILIVELEEIFP